MGRRILDNVLNLILAGPQPSRQCAQTGRTCPHNAHAEASRITAYIACLYRGRRICFGHASVGAHVWQHLPYNILLCAICSMIGPFVSEGLGPKNDGHQACYLGALAGGSATANVCAPTRSKSKCAPRCTHEIISCWIRISTCACAPQAFDPITQLYRNRIHASS